MFQIKIGQIKFFYKLGTYVYLPPEWSYGTPKITMFEIQVYRNGKVPLQKITITSINALNKSRWELNFLQNSQWKHMDIPPPRLLWS